MSDWTASSSNVAVDDSPPTKPMRLAARGIVALEVVIRTSVLAGLCYTVVVIWPPVGLILLGFIPIVGYAVWNLVALAAEVHLLLRPRASIRSTRNALRLVAIAAVPRLIWTVSMWMDDRVRDRWIVALLSAATVIVLITSGLFELRARQGDDAP